MPEKNIEMKETTTHLTVIFLSFLGFIIKNSEAIIIIKAHNWNNETVSPHAYTLTTIGIKKPSEYINEVTVVGPKERAFISVSCDKTREAASNADKSTEKGEIAKICGISFDAKSIITINEMKYKTEFALEAFPTLSEKTEICLQHITLHTEKMIENSSIKYGISA